jgi:flagellar motor protein MotB
MVTPAQFRQDQPYRRGLILGLTLAEIMILLIFILLMMLAAALADREDKIELMNADNRLRMISILQEAYPDATTPDDYWEELTSAVQIRHQVENEGKVAADQQFLKDAEIGRRFRRLAEEQGLDDPKKALRYAKAGREATDAAKRAGEKDPAAFISKAAAETRRGKAGEWPPYFSLDEARGYYFDSGKATLRPEFKRNLIDKVVPLLVKNLRDYDVDVIEVIGHTDEVPMTGGSNLDSRLIEASAGRFPISGLRSTDNPGLAMARAVSVAQVLRADSRLKSVTVLPLSGAQMIVPVDMAADGTQRSSDQKRRRIEMRLRRSTSQVEAESLTVVK